MATADKIKVMIYSLNTPFYSTARTFASVPSAVRNIRRKAYAKHGRWNPVEMWIRENGKWVKQDVSKFI